MKKKVKASLNKAKNTETPPPKVKRIDIPAPAKAEIARMNSTLNNFLAGMVVGMGIKGKWRLDMQRMQIIVEDTDGKNKT